MTDLMAVSLFAGVGGFDLALRNAETTVEQADGPRYRQMGNAVAVPVVEWIVRRIVAVENGELT